MVEQIHHLSFALIKTSNKIKQSSPSVNIKPSNFLGDNLFHNLVN